ncbi:MAG: hypothetical protein RLZZ360_58 [Candidatus Parcubacteria bacterium]|jgi:hypothetical protein
MEMFNLENLEILHLVLFSIPGYFLLAVGGFEFKSEFGHIIQSFFWGFAFVALTYTALTKINIMPQDVFSNPYTAMIIFSLMAMGLGLVIAQIRNKIKS